MALTAWNCGDRNSLGSLPASCRPRLAGNHSQVSRPHHGPRALSRPRTSPIVLATHACGAPVRSLRDIFSKQDSPHLPPKTRHAPHAAIVAARALEQAGHRDTVVGQWRVRRGKTTRTLSRLADLAARTLMPPGKLSARAAVRSRNQGDSAVRRFPAPGHLSIRGSSAPAMSA